MATRAPLVIVAGQIEQLQAADSIFGSVVGNGLRYTYSTTTTASDPGSGFLRFNNATLSSATALYISETDLDGNALAAVLATWDDSTSTIKGTLRLTKESDPTKFAVYQITGTLTDNGTWDTFSVTHVANGTLANNDVVRVSFTRTGDLGATGSTGSTGATGANGLDGLMMGGRLTLETGVPVSSADQTAKTTIYLTPFHHQYIALYDGSNFVRYEYTSDVSVAVPSTTNKPFDIFAYQSSGTVTLETLDWTNDTTRATALTRLKGTLVKSGDGTRRYLGTCRTTGSSGQTEDSQAKRLLWNMYNRVPRKLKKSAGTSTWTQTNSSGVYRAANSDATNHMEYVSGQADGIVYIDLAILVQGSLVGTDGQVNIGVNSQTTPAGSSELRVTGTASAFQIRSTSYLDIPAVGYNEFYWIEASTNTTTVFPGASRFEGFAMM